MIIAICDDDIQERERYYKKISEISREANLNIEVQNYSDGQQLLFEMDKKDNIPDIIYLDIFMPVIDGIELANKLRAQGYDGEIIFLTRSDEYWSNAFDVHAYHYLVKDDCSDEKFKEVLQSAIRNVWEKNEDYVLFNNCGTSLAVKVKEIYYFEVTGRIVSVVYQDGRFEFYSTLSKLEEQLLSRNFIRVHKSYLVSCDQVVKVSRDGVLLKNNEKIPIGRKYKDAVNAKFSQKER